MRKIKRVISLVLMFMLCVVPVSAFAQGVNNGNTLEKEQYPYDITGTLIKTQDETTGVNNWLIKDDEGVQYEIEPSLPAMEKAFTEYEGLQVSVSGNRARHVGAPLEVNQISYNRYLCTVEMVLEGILQYKYNSEENKMKYVLVVNTVEGEVEYVLDDRTKEINMGSVGDRIVIGGSIYPNPNFMVGKLFK